MKFILDDDTVDNIVRQSLVEHAMFLVEDNDPLEFIGTKAALFSALCTAIEYYSSPQQWENFKEMTRGKKVE